MRINPIQFNFIQYKPQNTGHYPMHINNGPQEDVFSFRGVNNENESVKEFADLVPKHKGIVYKKIKDMDGNVIEKRPIAVDIVKSSEYTFDFIANSGYVGYATLDYISPDDYNEKNADSIDKIFYKDYDEEKISGPRIKVDFVNNSAFKEYTGVGHLADLLEVAACKELGIKPCIISVSTTWAAPLHYIRGKRFIPFEKYFTEKQLERYKYDKTPNDMVKEIIENTPKGAYFDTTEIKNQLLMYMPEKMIKELEEELKEYPIF